MQETPTAAPSPAPARRWSRLATWSLFFAYFVFLLGYLPDHYAQPEHSRCTWLMIGAVLLWVIAGVAALFLLYHLGLAIVDGRWRAVLPAKNLWTVLRQDIQATVHDPALRPKEPTAQKGKDAFIFLLVATANLFFPLLVVVLLDATDPEKNVALTAITVGAAASAVFGCVGLFRAGQFLYAWRRVIGKMTGLWLSRFLPWLTAMIPLPVERRRLTRCFTWRALVRHLLWATLLLPVCHVLLLFMVANIMPYRFLCPSEVMLVEQASPSIFMQRSKSRGASRLYCTTRERVYAESSQVIEDFGPSLVLKIFLEGSRWYCKTTLDWTLQAGTERAARDGWTETEVQQQIRSLQEAVGEMSSAPLTPCADLLRILEEHEQFSISKGKTDIHIGFTDTDCRISLSDNGSYRYRLTADSFCVEKGTKIAFYDFNTEIWCEIWIDRSAASPPFSDFRASLAFALLQIWIALLLIMAPFFYLEGRPRQDGKGSA